jgi:Programmed cell death protein 2, C-terminal putative domain
MPVQQLLVAMFDCTSTVISTVVQVHTALVAARYAAVLTTTATLLLTVDHLHATAHRGGKPLWCCSKGLPKEKPVETSIATSTVSRSSCGDIPPCELCGTARTFEFQVMPQLLHYLGVDAVSSSKQRKSRTTTKDSSSSAATAKLAQDALRKIEQQQQQQQQNSEVQQVEVHPEVHPEVAGGLDWGVLAVYTCPRNCSDNSSSTTATATTTAAAIESNSSSSSSSSSSGYVREFVWRQGPMDGAYVDSDSDSDCDDTTNDDTATATAITSNSTSSVAKSTATAGTTAASSPSKSTSESPVDSGIDSSSDAATATADQ